MFVTGVESARAAMTFDNVKVFAEMADLQQAVLAELPGVASLLVKGSRFMKMERVVDAVVAAQARQEATC